MITDRMAFWVILFFIPQTLAWFLGVLDGWTIVATAVGFKFGQWLTSTEYGRAIKSRDDLDGKVREALSNAWVNGVTFAGLSDEEVADDMMTYCPGFDETVDPDWTRKSLIGALKRVRVRME